MRSSPWAGFDAPAWSTRRIPAAVQEARAEMMSTAYTALTQKQHERPGAGVPERRLDAVRAWPVRITHALPRPSGNLQKTSCTRGLPTRVTDARVRARRTMPIAQDEGDAIAVPQAIGRLGGAAPERPSSADFKALESGRTL